MYRDTKLYPTPDNFQRDIDDRLSWWISYLQDMLGKIPEEERAGARIIFTADGPSIWYSHLLTATEVLQEKNASQRAKLIELRDRILADGFISADEQKWIAENLKDL